MAAQIKFNHLEKLLNAANDTINDLLQERHELQQQIYSLMASRKNESRSNREPMDIAA